MFLHCKVPFVIIVIFNFSLITAKSSIYHTSHENMKDTRQQVNASSIEQLSENDKPQGSFHEHDAFDDFLDLDDETGIDVYHVLLEDLDGADRDLMDHKLKEAENTKWVRKSAYHRYVMQIFDDIMRYHEVRTKITDYNV